MVIVKLVICWKDYFMQVGGNFVGNDIPDSWRGCSCDACCSYSGESARRRAIDIHKRCNGLFINDEVGDRSSDYASLLRSSNKRDLKELKSFKVLVGLEFVDNNIILRNPISCSSKYFISFALLSSLLLVIFVVFAIMVYKGAVHITGISSEMLTNITKFVGVIICALSSFYSLLVLGYMLGCRSESDYKKYDNVLNYYESNLKSCSAVQKRIGFALNRCHRGLQSCVSDLKFAVAISNISRDSTLLGLLSEHLYIGKLCEEVRLKIESVDYEITKLRSDNLLKSREVNTLGEKNMELYNDNERLKSKLDDLLSRLSEL